MHKFITQYLAISFVLLSLPAVSYSQNGYKVEISVGSSKLNENTSDTKNTLVGAEIFFDKVTIGSHPYAEAAFLEQASSFVVAHFSTDLTSTAFDFSTDETFFGIQYVVPDSLLIFRGVYVTGGGDYENGLNGDIDANGFILDIGKYITRNSAILVSYSQLDGEANFIPSTTVTIKATEIGVGYKIVENLQDGAGFNFELVLTSSNTDFNTTSETNTMTEFSGDYYLNQAISIGASLEMNSGDDKDIEGKTLGLNLNMFLTPSFVIDIEFNQFMADNTTGDDSDEVTLQANIRF